MILETALLLDVSLAGCPVARKFADRFGNAPAGWLEENRPLVRRAVELVRMKEGDEAAEILWNAFLED